MKSTSSSQNIPFSLKLREAYRQFKGLLESRNPFSSCDFSHLSRQFIEYDALTRLYIGSELSQVRAFEIGCGQRPYRLFYLLSQGVDAYGVDIDKILLSLNIPSILESLNKNGCERTLKTVLRYIIFDRNENKQFKKFLENESGREFDWPLDRISYGNSADISFWPDLLVDFIFSEDVFEHIPGEVLPIVCQNMAKKLSKEGIAFIRPMIYTGIKGGHNVEWYNTDPSTSRECPPWDHLRKHLYPANTYLNKLHIQDYRDLFSEYFIIIEELVDDKLIGNTYLNSNLRKELLDYTDEDLFANHVGFILRLKY